MKHFLKFIISLFLLIVLVGVALDFGYTYIFRQSDHRNKVEYVINSENRNYDVVIMGTSRANNHFVASMFEENGLKTFNYGISGSHLFETSLLLKMMIARNYKIKNIILETDLNLCNEKRDAGTTAWFMPFLHESEIIRKHYEKESDFKQLYYLPFYRYIQFDNRIGFRAMYHTLIEQPVNYLHHLGYHALPNNKKGNMKNNIVSLKPLKNKYYEEIKQICKANNIRLISVMTPMCSNVKGMEHFDKVKALHPEIHNYENVVQGDDCFSSCGHMNDKGARLFTEQILNDFFRK